MGSEYINVSYGELTNEIGVLRAMMQDAESNNQALSGAKSQAMGGGESVAAIELMADSADSIHSAFVQVLQNTISFLQSAQQSMSGADRAAAVLMEK